MTQDLQEIGFNSGDIIIEQGEPAMEAYLIISGQVKVFLEKDGQETELARLGENEIFGETALFKGSDYGASVMATSDTVLAPITPDILDIKIRKCDPMIRALMRMMMARLRQTNAALIDAKTGQPNL